MLPGTEASVPGSIGGIRVFQIGAEKSKARVITSAAHKQFPWRAICNILTGIIHNTGLHLGRGHTKTILAHRTLAAGSRNADTRPGFGHGPGLDKRKPEPRLKRGMQLAVNAGPETETDLVLPVTVIFRPSHQDGRHHPQIMENGGIAVRYGICPPVRMKSVERDKRATGGDHRHHGIGKRIHMKHRQRGQHHLFAGAQVIGGPL